MGLDSTCTPSEIFRPVFRKETLKDQNPRRRRDRADVRRAGVGMMIPAIVAASILVGVWLGHAFDKWFGTNPWGMLVGLFLGIATAIRETISLLKKINSEDADEDNHRRR